MARDNPGDVEILSRRVFADNTALHLSAPAQPATAEATA